MDAPPTDPAKYDADHSRFARQSRYFVTKARWAWSGETTCLPRR